ncbi:hypothetical protein MMC08_007795 [Hypocenomyce scalaris]|nr:hypothetical protein [Hypocenomyce scalaris]
MTEKHYSRTIFHSIHTSDLPASQLDTIRLTDEAQTLIGAGTITTASTLKITTYHILANPHILPKLVAELDNAIPDPSYPLPLQRLEQLKYLSAVINEGFRLSCDTSHRFQRVFRDRTLQFHDWTIEPGTPVSMSAVAMHTNPNIFPDPQTFDPDRWLANSLSGTPDIPSSGDSDSLGINDRYNTRLDKYLVPFLKGSRACAGMNLAYADIYLTLANLLRRFDMQLSGVVRERDVDVIHDFLNTSPTLESTEMKALVTGVRE